LAGFILSCANEKSLPTGREHNQMAMNDTDEKDQEASLPAVEVVTPLELERNGFVRKGEVFFHDKIARKDLDALLGLKQKDLIPDKNGPDDEITYCVELDGGRCVIIRRFNLKFPEPEEKPEDRLVEASVYFYPEDGRIKVTPALLKRKAFEEEGSDSQSRIFTLKDVKLKEVLDLFECKPDAIYVALSLGKGNPPPVFYLNGGWCSLDYIDKNASPKDENAVVTAHVHVRTYSKGQKQLKDE
jgi:hypothetical protein